MGGMHLNAWQELEGARVTAVCTRSPVSGKARQGNIAGKSDELDLTGIAIYSDLAEMLLKAELDAVSITLPTQLHKAVTIQCLQAGLHVLCEKPMALNVADCELMIDAANQAGKELMIAHCIRFWPEYVWLKKTVEAQTYGTIRVADFERLTSAPAWSEGSWLADSSKSGGITLDLHIHDLDFIQHLLGLPRATLSKHIRLDGGEIAHTRTILDYGPDLLVSATASWLMPESFGFKMGYQIVFENAAAVFDGQQLKVFPAEGETFEPDLPSDIAYHEEVRHFSECIQKKEEPRRITPVQAAESVRLALQTLESI